MEEEKNQLEFFNSIKKYDDVLQGDSGKEGKEAGGKKGNIDADLFGSGAPEQVIKTLCFIIPFFSINCSFTLHFCFEQSLIKMQNLVWLMYNKLSKNMLVNI